MALRSEVTYKGLPHLLTGSPAPLRAQYAGQTDPAGLTGNLRKGEAGGLKQVCQHEMQILPQPNWGQSKALSQTFTKG